MIQEIFWCLMVAFGISQLANIPTSLYLHRGTTHRAVDFHPAVEFLFQLTLWLTTGIKRDRWVAVHLHHHAHTDEPEDPHSPIHSGFWRVLLLNVYLCWLAAKTPAIMSKYEGRVRLSWAERNIFSSWYLGIVVGVSLASFALGWWQGMLVYLLHGMFYILLNSAVNAYCHVRGYKNFPQADAGNCWLLSLFTCGEGFHNTHHARPASAKLSDRWFEFDPGWQVIKILSRLKLAVIKSARVAAN